MENLASLFDQLSYFKNIIGKIEYLYIFLLGCMNSNTIAGFYFEVCFNF